MIPLFPNFKKVEIDDRVMVEKYTAKFKPYSDFNFTNFWSWDTNGDRRVSELHGNLVVIFTDYVTRKPFLSFIGTNKTKETISALLRYAENNGIPPILQFITKETVQHISKSKFYITEDEENFDYIFSVEELAYLQGSKFKKKRHLTSKFKRENPNASFELHTSVDTKTQEEILSVFHRWKSRKTLDKKEYGLAYEEMALKRLFKISDTHEHIFSYVRSPEGAMIGFSIDELLHNGYAISHFIKADTTYKGIYEFLNENVAGFLLSQNVVFWNWEQDLNLEGLRQLKKSYRPVNFLRKYRVSSLATKQDTWLSTFLNRLNRQVSQ